MTKQEQKELELFKRWWESIYHPVSKIHGIEMAEMAWIARSKITNAPDWKDAPDLANYAALQERPKDTK